MSATFRDFMSHARYSKMHRLSLFSLFVMLVVGISVGFGVASTNTRTKASDDAAYNLAIFTSWQEKITSALTRSSMLAAALAAFAKSSATQPMNFSAPTMDRVQIIKPDAFVDVCRDLYDANSGIATLQLQSGAVVSQVYPPNSSWLYTDIMLQPQFSSYEEIFRTGQGVTIGPLRLYESFGGDFCFVIRYPVYIGSNKTRDNFWGIGNVIITIDGLLKALQANEKMAYQGFDFAIWYVTPNMTTATFVASNNASNFVRTMNKGLKIALPIGERGKEAYFAMYPKRGFVSYQIPRETIAAIVLGTVFSSLFIVVIFYAAMFGVFVHRHRFAPRIHTKGVSAPTFAVIVALRGAQPLLELAPGDTQRTLLQFIETVKLTATVHGCYAVCAVGDRAVHVVSADALCILRFAEDVVANTNYLSSHAFDLASSMAQSTKGGATQHRSVPKSMITSDDEGIVSPTASSVKNLVACHATGFIAIDTLQHSARYYDVQRDVYYYGAHRTLKCIGSFIDELRPGELGWTAAFGSYCESNDTTNKLTSHLKAMRSSRSITEKGKVTAIVIGWWSPNYDDEEESVNDRKLESSSEPSLAMAILNDIYLKRMTSLMTADSGKRESLKGGTGSPHSKGIALRKPQKVASSYDLTQDNQKDSPLSSAIYLHSPIVTEADSDPRRKSDEFEDTYLNRFGTLLCIQLEGDPRASLGTIRRVADQHRGTIVNGYENTIVISYNIISAGGNHQMRAADTVSELRTALSCQFVGAIYDGKIGALVSDGLIMCTGDVASLARALLTKANELAQMYVTPTAEIKPPAAAFVRNNTSDEDDGEDVVMSVCTVDEILRSNGDGELRSPASTSPATTPRTALIPTPARFSAAPRGFCLLLCFSEVSSKYDCEAVSIECQANNTELASGRSDDQTQGSRQQASLQIIYRLGEQRISKHDRERDKSTGIGAAAAAAQQHLAAIGMAGPRATTLASDVAGCDEWMYCLKDDDSAFHSGNEIFEHIRQGDMAEARRLYTKLCLDPSYNSNVSACVRMSLTQQFGR